MPFMRLSDAVDNISHPFDVHFLLFTITV